MSTILIVSEKPSSSQKIAEALGKAEKKQGYFEVKRGSDTIQVAPAVGHLYTLTQEAKHSGYPTFDLKWVPTPEASEHFEYAQKYITVLKKLASKADSIIVACDYDVEGELIGYNIWRFMAPKLKAKRMRFSTLTKEELNESFENLQDVSINTAKAGEARHILDWYFGINLSRALMGAIKAAGRFKVMSIGRVQGPALALLSQREKEVNAFKPTPYWQVFADVESILFNHESDRFLDKSKAEAVVATAPKSGVISKVSKTTYSMLPPNPHDLTSLQMDSYGAFGFTPARTLELAQFLYENAFISYPRTSSQQLSEKLNLKKIVSSLAKQSNYASDAGKILTTTSLKPNNGKKTDPAHPAIHPTGLAPGKLRDDHAKLYDLIVRNFLACFAQAAKRERVGVTATFGKENFKASGAVTVEKGWLAMFPYHEVKDTVVNFNQGQKVAADKIYMEEKETQPPKHFSPASIVKKLEDLNLGTKATRAEVIETLYSRDYIRDKKSIQTTPFGLCVYEALLQHCPGVLSEELTRNVEIEMEEIIDGKTTPEKVIASNKKIVAGLCEEFKAHELEIGKHLLTSLNSALFQAAQLGPCKCSGTLLIRRSKFGQFVGCSKYPECKVTFPLPHSAFIIPTEKICEKCHTPIIGVRRKAKKFFSMCVDPKCETKANWGHKAAATPNATPNTTAASSAVKPIAASSVAKPTVIPSAAAPGLNISKFTSVSSVPSAPSSSSIKPKKTTVKKNETKPRRKKNTP
ncbi:MAG: DNA topoisomerase I [Candidatus Micrarchaeota archaeon]|nr:DNA topoisomerase I [Candidatus Micrarchaeota archaeon]